MYGFVGRENDNRRKPPGERKTYDIKQMWNRTHEIANLAALGYSNIKIAGKLGITPQTVSNTVNGQLCREKILEIRESRDEDVKKVIDEVDELTKKAIKVYNEIFDNQSEQADLKMRKSVADTVLLELSGLRAPIRTESKSVHTSASLTEIEEFKERGMKAARESGMIVEVDYETKEITHEPKTGTE